MSTIDYPIYDGAGAEVGLSEPHAKRGTSADVVDLEGEAQATLSTSTTAAQTAVLPPGLYDVWGSVDTYVKVAEVANNVTTGTGYLVRAGETLPNVVVRRNRKIGAILAAGTGTLYYHRVG